MIRNQAMLSYVLMFIATQQYSYFLFVYFCMYLFYIVWWLLQKRKKKTSNTFFIQFNTFLSKSYFIRNQKREKRDCDSKNKESWKIFHCKNPEAKKR